jgi:hypothetical protein
LIGIAAAAAAGFWAAARVPLFLHGRRWTELLAVPERRGRARAPRGTARFARLTVRVLAAVPLTPWRNTCLYRSIAECLALRSFGVPAVVRIGVRPGTPGEGSILAHAWVVVEPSAEPPPPDRMRAFSLRG